METTLAEELRLNKISNILKIGAIIGLFVIAYYPALVILNAKYSAIDSYYSHGYLVPFISAYIIWDKRNKLKDMVVVPSNTGLWVLMGGLLLYLFANWWYVNFFAASSMVIVLAGLSLYLLGKKITKEFMFPLAFLLFMIPLPKIVIIYFTFWLKLFAASIATKVVVGMGIPAVVQGAFISLPDTIIEVDNACSGLRSLISLLALGITYAYFLRATLWKKLFFSLMSLPIAIVANLIRIVVLVLVNYVYSPTAETFKMIDTTTGFLVFAFAFMGLHFVKVLIQDE